MSKVSAPSRSTFNIEKEKDEEKDPKAEKKKQRKRLLIGGVVLLIAGAAAYSYITSAADTAGSKLVFVHINDHHGHLPAEDLFINRTLAYIREGSFTDVRSDSSLYVKYGGYAMIAARFKQIEDQWLREDGDKATVFRLHAGDALTGTAYYSLFAHGEVDALMMSELCFDAFVLGNHEFDDGDQNLAYFIESLQTNTSARCNRTTAVLAANVVPGESSPIKGLIKPYEIVERDGIKLGIVGVDTKNKTMESSSPSHGTYLTDEIVATQASVNELIQQGITHIAVLSHVGLNFDLEDMSQRLTGVDIIVGGDSHSLMSGTTTGQLLKGWNVGPEEDYPKLIKNANTGDTMCVVQAWDFAHIVGELIVDFNGDGVVTDCSGGISTPYDASSFFEVFWEAQEVLDPDGNLTNETVQVTRALAGSDLTIVQEDFASLPGFASAAGDARYAEVSEILSAYTAVVDEKSQVSVGIASDTLLADTLPGKWSGAATWKHGADLGALQGKVFVERLQHGCLGIVNGGSIRYSIEAGEVSYGDILAVFPYSNTLYEMTMTGQQIKDVLEAVLFYIKQTGRGGGFPYGWGIRYKIDLREDEGSILSEIEVNCKVAAGSWTSLDLGASYNVATSSYIAGGYDGYTLMADTDAIPDRTQTGLLEVPVMVDYVRALHERGETLSKLPFEEYAVQEFVDENGCSHSSVPYGQCPGQQLVFGDSEESVLV